MTRGREASSWLDARARAVRVVMPLFLLGVFPVLMTVWFWITLYNRQHTITVDFHHALWPAGRAVLDGRSPYPTPDPGVLGTARNFVFPAPTALLIAPFALLPLEIAEVLFALILVLAAFATLRILGVRDARCYGALFLWAPVFAAVETGNVTLLLALGAAVAWRWRDRPVVAGLATAMAVSMKLVLWPLLFWLLATRRYAAAALGVVSGVILTTLAYSLPGLGLSGFEQYLHVLRVLGHVMAKDSYTPFALAVELGAPDQVARWVGFAIAAAALGACVAGGRRTGGDRASFVLAVAVSLLASPIVWIHYFALLAVPLAVQRPRFTPLWLLPAAT